MPTQAPEIDGVVHLRGRAAPGELVTARLTLADTYDFAGEIVTGAVDTPGSSPYIARPPAEG
jgi:hypothetical protein